MITLDRIDKDCEKKSREGTAKRKILNTYLRRNEIILIFSRHFVQLPIKNLNITNRFGLL